MADSVLLRNMYRSALLLGSFAVAGATLVAFTWQNTHERIAANERAALLRDLNLLVPAQAYDNDLFTDTIEVVHPELLGTTALVTVYRARSGQASVAAILTPVAPDGYSGPIRLLVGIRPDGTLAGVRVGAHKETPGLGDGIETRRSDWVLSFDERSLDDPQLEQWAVQRDGGYFDQLTGATITPRAVVQAVKNALIYFETEKDRLFE